MWSLHPRHLDRQGLTAAWREALLAQKVLQGGTRGYRNHPQLQRFRATDQADAAIASYLRGVLTEAGARGYTFDAGKVPDLPVPSCLVPVTDGQVAYEWAHLRAKLAVRSPDVLTRWADVLVPDVHPIFAVVPGPVEPWEVLVRAASGGAAGGPSDASPGVSPRSATGPVGRRRPPVPHGTRPGRAPA